MVRKALGLVAVVVCAIALAEPGHAAPASRAGGPGDRSPAVSVVSPSWSEPDKVGALSERADAGQWKLAVPAVGAMVVTATLLILASRRRTLVVHRVKVVEPTARLRPGFGGRRTPASLRVLDRPIPLSDRLPRPYDELDEAELAESRARRTV